jgi:hypothetical protein
VAGLETSIVACWLVPEGKTRDSGAHSLRLHPENLRISARSAEQITAQLMDNHPEAFRNLNATLYLRDASDREYAIQVNKISPGIRLQKIADLPVREE